METCEKCNKEMKNLGNISGSIYTTDPIQWDDVYVCDNCKIKKTVRGVAEVYDPTGGRNLDEYSEECNIACTQEIDLKEMNKTLTL